MSRDRLQTVGSMWRFAGNLSNDRTAALFVVGAVTALSWSYLYVIGNVDGAADWIVRTVVPGPWSAGDTVAAFAFWNVALLAVMLPGAAPGAFDYVSASRWRGGGWWAAGLFVAGYASVWATFAMVPTILHWILAQSYLLSPNLVLSSPLLGALMLIGAGIYQFAPPKRLEAEACPGGERWPQAGSAFLIGQELGALSLAAGWPLAALLVIGGAFNLFWVAGLAAFVFAEKSVSFRRSFTRAGGLWLVLVGLIVLAVSP